MIYTWWVFQLGIPEGTYTFKDLNSKNWELLMKGLAGKIET
jgi:hypothetical protein